MASGPWSVFSSPSQLKVAARSTSVPACRALATCVASNELLATAASAATAAGIRFALETELSAAEATRVARPISSTGPMYSGPMSDPVPQ
ncbi:hypothetical protein [Corynebacterium singulare]|uniref:hypothetical protein n=1 Tax=Corynebacterium singulare TaxID=161899 RepID=UPI001F29BD4E|nr:hypothetical protein [Corynebacterium singulare]